VLRASRQSFPLVSLALEEAGTSELVTALRGEAVDAAFIRSPVADPAGLTVLALLEEEMLAVLPTGHALASGKAPLALAALAGETFVLYRRPVGPGLYDTIIAACHAAGFSPTVGQEAPRITSTLNLVAAALGVSVVPASLQRLHMEGVVFRRIKGSRPRAPLNLVTRRGDPSAALRRFVALVHKAAKS